jgi:hypothetical protein
MGPLFIAAILRRDIKNMQQGGVADARERRLSYAKIEIQR